MADKARTVEELQKKLAQLRQECKAAEDENARLRAENLEKDAEIERELKAARDKLAPALRRLKSEIYDNHEDLSVYMEACQMESMILGKITELEHILDDLKMEEEEGADNKKIQASFQEIINELRKLWTEGNGKGESLETYWKRMCDIWAEGNKKVEESGLDLGVTFGKPSAEDFARFE
ncbi:hypothetical protein BC567DRAFT_213912 [Phyllosticta citribraziliensis]